MITILPSEWPEPFCSTSEVFVELDRGDGGWREVSFDDLMAYEVEMSARNGDFGEVLLSVNTVSAAANSGM
jgi:hypothetical protein